MSEEFSTHDVLQDHVNVAWVVEGAEHVHDEWMLQFRQNPMRNARQHRNAAAPKAMEGHFS